MEQAALQAFNNSKDSATLLAAKQPLISKNSTRHGLMVAVCRRDWPSFHGPRGMKVSLLERGNGANFMVQTKWFLVGPTACAGCTFNAMRLAFLHFHHGSSSEKSSIEYYNW